MSTGPESGRTCLRMEGVRKQFGAIQALNGVTIEVKAGEVHALIGENGAGKSTLMKLLAGVYRPDQGSMWLEGMPYRPSGPRDARRHGVVMIFQELAIAPHLSVEANIMLGQEQTRFGLLQRRRHRRRVSEILDLLDHPEIRPDSQAGGLSIGAQQLVEVARALVSEARVLILDEPTSALGARDSERLFEVIRRLKDQGIAVVYISHFLEEAERLADRYTVLRDGRSVESSSMTGTNRSRIIAAMVGRDLQELFPKVEHHPGKQALVLEDLDVSGLGGPVELELRQGEILGLAGLVGAGRTELLRAVFGLDAVRSGRVRVAGITCRRSGPAGRIRAGLGFLSEDRKREGLALAMSVEDNLTLSSLGRYCKYGFLQPRDKRQATIRWLHSLKIRSTGPAQGTWELSGGNQQKVALGRLLHQEADVYLLDEPTRGIDVGSKAEIYRIIGELAARGKAVLMVSSYLPELLGVCDRIAIMSRGRLYKARAASDWTEHEIMRVATGSI